MVAPAARLGDSHLCPIHGPVVAGIIAMPATLPTVFINARSAITAGSLCICDSAPNIPHIIPGGSATVFINKRAVARVLDATGHPGGRITTGSPNVFIGDYAAFAAARVFPGQQNFGNCGLMNCQQIIRQATGQYWKEVDFLSNATTAGFAGFNVLHEQLGSMTASQQTDLLTALSVPSTTSVISNYHAISTGDIIATDAELRRTAKEKLLWALGGRKGVIASVDAGKLWQNTNRAGYGHGIVITEEAFNEKAELTHVYINDTGQNKQGRRMTIDEILDAMPLIGAGLPMYVMVITDNAIWHRPPPAPFPGPTSFPNCPTPYPSDATANRGLIISGAPDVLTGDYMAAAAARVFPGLQVRGNCVLQCANQVIEQATGIRRSEQEVYDYARANNLTKPNGASSFEEAEALIERLGGVLTDYFIADGADGAEDPQDLAKEELTEALRAKKWIIASVDSHTLWGENNHGSHAILITKGDFNEQGELTHVYFNDTGSDQQGRRMTRAKILDAMCEESHYGFPKYEMLTTIDSLWDRVQ